MIDSIPKNSSSEIPIWFRANDQDLFGVITLPQSVPRRIGVVFLDGGQCVRNRLSAVLARRLAESGFHVFRFDYHGTGESSGECDTFELHRPFTADLMSAVDELRRRGVDEFILVGRCFGARTALSAVGRIPRLRGLALISMPWYDTIAWSERFLDALPPGLRFRTISIISHRTPLGSLLRFICYGIRNWVRRPWPLSRKTDRAGVNWISPHVESRVRRAIEDGVPLLFLHGAEDSDSWEFRRVQEGDIGALLARTDARVQVFTSSGHMHGLLTISIQQTVITRIHEWADAVASTGP